MAQEVSTMAENAATTTQEATTLRFPEVQYGVKWCRGLGAKLTDDLPNVMWHAGSATCKYSYSSLVLPVRTEAIAAVCRIFRVTGLDVSLDTRAQTMGDLVKVSSVAKFAQPQPFNVCGTDRAEGIAIAEQVLAKFRAQSSPVIHIKILAKVLADLVNANVNWTNLEAIQRRIRGFSETVGPVLGQMKLVKMVLASTYKPHCVNAMNTLDFLEGHKAAVSVLDRLADVTSSQKQIDVLADAIGDLIDFPLNGQNVENTLFRLQGFATIVADKLADRVLSTQILDPDVTKHDASSKASMDYPVAEKAMSGKFHDQLPITPEIWESRCMNRTEMAQNIARLNGKPAKKSRRIYCVHP